MIMNQDYTLAEATGEGLPITLRKFWRLLELTRDMDRNESDADFIRNGGKILYVFDENIFQLILKHAIHDLEHQFEVYR